jgi:isocitrate dehydrogenase
VAPDYPEIESWHVIVDNCAHQLVKKPEQYDVIVTTNMNGDILSDLTSGLVGGLGFAPSANLGSEVAIFEAVHGSAPKYAGKDTINPTAMIGASTMMLRHLRMFEQASAIENGLFYTLESGVATRDVVGDERAVGTTAFTDAVIANLGKKAQSFQVREYRPIAMPQFSPDPVRVRPSSRSVVGVDVFVESGLQPDELGPSMERLAEGSALALKVVTNRGTRVYPSTGTLTDCVDSYPCRFVPASGGEVTDADILDLLGRIAAEHRWNHVEKLYEFDGEPAFTKAQGED